MMLRSCFYVVWCSCWRTSCASLFNACVWLMIYGVGRLCLRLFLVQILCFMFLLNPDLWCLIALVGICCLLLCMIMKLKPFMPASLLVQVSMLKSAEESSMCRVKVSQSTRSSTPTVIQNLGCLSFYIKFFGFPATFTYLVTSFRRTVALLGSSFFFQHEIRIHGR